MNNFLIEYKNKKSRRNNKKYIIESTIKEIQNIDLLNTSAIELYRSINSMQKNLKNIQ